MESRFASAGRRLRDCLRTSLARAGVWHLENGAGTVSIEVKGHAGDWLAAWRAYLFVAIGGHLAWEVAQLPLYTQMATASAREITFAVIGCTAGDLMIASLAFVASLVLLANNRWPAERFGRVSFATVAMGLAYTVFSEGDGFPVRHPWTYASAMPILPFVGTGLSPALQWLVVPLCSLWAARLRQRMPVVETTTARRAASA